MARAETDGTRNRRRQGKLRPARAWPKIARACSFLALLEVEHFPNFVVAIPCGANVGKLANVSRRRTLGDFHPGRVLDGEAKAVVADIARARHRAHAEILLLHKVRA